MIYNYIITKTIKYNNNNSYGDNPNPPNPYPYPYEKGDTTIGDMLTDGLDAYPEEYELSLVEEGLGEEGLGEDLKEDPPVM